MIVIIIAIAIDDHANSLATYSCGNILEMVGIVRIGQYVIRVGVIKASRPALPPFCLRTGHSIPLLSSHHLHVQI